ncbi:uncharacterized protein H6S33_000777 [Morchella sextelata]|uniref:uncharacterized protein n=1 Tax=Morchella sextelata TaxID=1174677 RepID=UPI001D04A3AC|nr:uncharacterized protein H6S33_000777 [Morchella sextelata]KAH0615141.1 hypothetical protein H6S33_000777 [Morchella sextelata]
MVSLLCNPLATAEQLASSPSRSDGVPADLETTLRWAGCTLIQSAGILLQLPQKTIATASILFQRFYLLSSLRAYPLLPTVHGALYLSTKLTEHPTKPRDIINVTSYLLSCPSPSPISPPPSKSHPAAVTPEQYYVSESTYYTARTALLAAETQILRATGFQTAVSLPYALAINYLQALDALDGGVVRRAFGYLTDALVSPGLLYLTHQPNSLAVAAAYLAAREEGVKLPGGWWEVFDVEREELGFLVVGMKGVTEFVEKQVKVWRREGGLWGVDELEMALERRRVLDEAMEE